MVASPRPSHERFAGRLCIPYYNRSGVIALVFRCILDHDCGAFEGHRKYDQPDGQTQFLYNAPALDGPKRIVHVTEGELDALVLSEVLGEPVVGVSGIDKWQPHWPAHFVGFDRIVLWRDGDNAGKAMAASWAQKVGAEDAGLPWGKDVGDVFREQGADGLIRIYKGEEDEDLPGDDYDR